MTGELGPIHMSWVGGAAPHNAVFVMPMPTTLRAGDIVTFDIVAMDPAAGPTVAVTVRAPHWWQRIYRRTRRTILAPPT